MAVATSLAGRGRLNAYDSISASTTDEAIVSAVPGKKVRVIAFVINQGDTTPSTVTFNSKGSGAGTAISPAWKGGANGVISVSDCSTGWFETKVGEGLSISTGAGSVSGVNVVYELVSA